MPGIMAFFTALPQLLAMLDRIGSLTERLLKYTQEKNLEKWISELEGNIDALEKAKTPEEILASASALAGSIRRI
jgi:hypothetical protein